MTPSFESTCCGLSTGNAGTNTWGKYTYTWKDGTSMACPHISGLVALMLSVNPALTPAEVQGVQGHTLRIEQGFWAGNAVGDGRISFIYRPHTNEAVKSSWL